MFLAVAMMAAAPATNAQQDKNNRPQGQQNPAATDKGVIINGVKWATRNVDKPGTFADKPESAGKFYQWNRKKAWDVTGESVSGWDSSDISGAAWEKVNDPSPAGWHVPTLGELQKLLDKEKVNNEWTTLNGVTGRKFTDKETANSIFLPAAGFRKFTNGMLDGVGLYGGYWSGTPSGDYTFSLGFHEENSNWWKYYNYPRIYGFNVRSVAD